MKQLHIQKTKGFTLLESIVALTITGFLLGGLFSLIAGSKELSFRAVGHLSRSLELRTISNFSILQDGYNEIESILGNDRFNVEEAYELSAPVRKTQPMNHSLKAFEVTDSETGTSFLLSGWQQEDLPK
jgi:prepilin-type N-terminal cleavage/methylation domain-containing protein